jgi:hypothetical protein
MVVSQQDLDPRVTALARPRNNCKIKFQINPLVREGVTHKETLNSHTENNNLVMGSRRELATETNWQSDSWP